MNIEETKKQVNEMQKQIENLIKLQDEALAKLPPEQYQKVQKYHADVHQMLRAMKKGDMDGIQNLLKKYADTNIK